MSKGQWTELGLPVFQISLKSGFGPLKTGYSPSRIPADVKDCVVGNYFKVSEGFETRDIKEPGLPWRGHRCIRVWSGVRLGSGHKIQTGLVILLQTGRVWRTDDRTYSLADFSKKAVVVVCFTCNSCPYSVDYEDRIIAFQKKYADHKDGVAIVAINANKKPSETLEKMKERGSSKLRFFPYVIDETQQVADAYRGEFHYEFFVLKIS
jgi:thiol-disulfide isomerase/thioredoxin